MKKHQAYLFIFTYFFLVRLIFSLVVGFQNNYSLQADSFWLVELADEALKGNFNFDIGRFISSPLYPLFVALHKYIFADYWSFFLVITQISLSSLSGIYLFKIAESLFSKRVATITALIFGIFPFTLWYVHTFSQETTFQCLFIMAVYYLISSLKKNHYKHVLLSSLLFSIAFLTKSHILIFSVFVPLFYFLNVSTRTRSLVYSLSYAGICLLATLPFGMYNKKVHDTYVLSSNGAKYQFYLGNTEAGYITVVSTPKKDSEDYLLMKDINNTAGYFNGSQAKYDSILALPHRAKQDLFFQESLQWIKQNPQKLIELKLYNLGMFLMPGVSFRHYPLLPWLFSFLVSFPVYFLAYTGMAIAMKRNPKLHFYMVGICLTMVAFSTIWYVQNRFRTITIEPFYLIYAAYSMGILYNKFKEFKNTTTFLQGKQTDLAAENNQEVLK